MESCQWLWDQCDIFIIEQQFIKLYGNNRGVNLDAIKLGAITYGWFVKHYPYKIINSFGSTNKTQILGAPDKMTKPERKKWSTVRAHNIFDQRNDREAVMIYDLPLKFKGKRLNNEGKIQSYLVEFENCDDKIKTLAEYIVRTRQKMDDISDTVIQLQAYKYLTFVNT